MCSALRQAIVTRLYRSNLRRHSPSQKLGDLPGAAITLVFAEHDWVSTRLSKLILGLASPSSRFLLSMPKVMVSAKRGYRRT